MLYVALLELGVICLLLWINTRERGTHDRTIIDLIASNESERQLLLDRIQRPELVPAQRVPPRHMTDEERARAEARQKHRAELAKVGTAQPFKEQ